MPARSPRRGLPWTVPFVTGGARRTFAVSARWQFYCKTYHVLPRPALSDARPMTANYSPRC